jgi:hypothetical protein
MPFDTVIVVDWQYEFNDKQLRSGFMPGFSSLIKVYEYNKVDMNLWSLVYNYEF